MNYIMDYKVFESHELNIEFTINNKLIELNNDWNKVLEYLKKVCIGNLVEFGVGLEQIEKSVIKDVKLLYTRNSITNYLQPSVYSFCCENKKEFYINSSRSIKISLDDDFKKEHPSMLFYDNLEFLSEFKIDDKLKEFKGNEDKLVSFLKDELIGKFVEFREYWDFFTTKSRPKIKHKIIKNVLKSNDKKLNKNKIVFISSDGEFVVDFYCLIKVYKIKSKEHQNSGIIIYDKFKELRNANLTLDFLKNTLIGKLIKFKNKKDGEIKKDVLNDIILIPGNGNATKNNYYIFRCEKGHQYEVDMYYPIEYMEKPEKKEIIIWDKFIKLGRSYENILNYLKENLIGRVVKFKTFENGNARTGEIIKKRIDDIKISQKIPDIIFICDGIEFKVNMIFNLEYYDIKVPLKKIEKSSSLDEEDDDNIMLIGVPSGEVLRVSRKKEFNNLYAKKFIFFANNYKPTFYGFMDDDKKKILDEINGLNK